MEIYKRMSFLSSYWMLLVCKFIDKKVVNNPNSKYKTFFSTGLTFENWSDFMKDIRILDVSTYHLMLHVPFIGIMGIGAIIGVIIRALI